MAAPSLVGSLYQNTFSTASSVIVTITNGFTAGNAVMVGVTQEQSTKRTINSIVDSGGANTYAVRVAHSTSGSDCSAYIWSAHAITALGAGGTVTVTFSGNTIGRAICQEITAATASGLSDSHTDGASANNHQSGATGLTTSGDVLVFCVGSLGGSGITSKTAGTNYTAIGDTTTTRNFFQYRASTGALTNDTGPWSHVGTARVNAGAQTAFYDAVGGGAVRPVLVGGRLVGLGLLRRGLVH
jgi:hypothetical protein